ncbi:hypothetical protein NMQ14_10270 [Methyloversatilis sp. XJ19-13]|nr:hypothetical protein [Methyloversatilis sp. XJ19-13]MCQ9374634.1 hypothetical protein [Methyloversatilis sp. XJ19-13]
MGTSLSRPAISPYSSSPSGRSSRKMPCSDSIVLPTVCSTV